jgi:hypothetical protein
MYPIISKFIKLFYRHKSTTEKYAELELDLLSGYTNEDGHPHPFSLEYRSAILRLIKIYEKFEHSGGSAPIAASHLGAAITSLCLQQPLSEITGDDREWFEVSVNNGISLKQNKRCYSLFRQGNEHPIYHYNDAIIWECDSTQENTYPNRFTGIVEGISSSQCVKQFPFTPKSFRVKVKIQPLDIFDLNSPLVHKVVGLDAQETLREAAVYYQFDLPNL